MNKSTSVFNINDINIASNTNFTFTFTAAQQVNYSNGVVLGDVTDETIRFSVSTDGSGYAPVALKVKKVGTGYWYLCTAEFKLPAGVSVDKITVRFDNYAGLENHGLRIDDFKLYEGGNGSELVVPAPETMTIADAIKGGADQSVEISATVVAMHTQGILIGDATGVMLAFIGATPEVAVNDVVTVKGTTEQRNGVIQLGKTGLTITKTGTGSYTTPPAEVMDGEAVTAYIATATANTAVYKYVKYNGEFTVSGNYYNVIISGTTVKGSVAYGKPEWASFNGKPVTVEGWLLGGTANYLQTMATSVTESTGPYISATAPATFKAEGETINVAFNVGNLGSNKVFAKIEGTDAGQFTLGAVGANSVPVTAKANDGAAKSAKLTLYVAASEGAAAVATTSVELKQAAKSSGEDTKGTFTSMSQFISDGGQYDNPCGLGDGATANGNNASGFKIGSSSKAGVFTSGAVGVTGDKKLGFYAVAWKGKKATIYIKVDNGSVDGESSFAINANETATGNPPFKLTALNDADYYVVSLKGLTAASTVSISTSPNFAADADKNTGRAIVCGVQLF